MHTRTRDKLTGLHSFTVYAPDGTVYAQGKGYADYRQCERDAQMHERALWLGAPKAEPCDSVNAMSDDELLAELMA